jgi:O-antigen/teichoic acid export membrane protein
MLDPSEPDIVTETQASHRNRQFDQGLSAIASGDLKRRSVRGGAATVLGQGFSMAVQIASTVVLARLLSPADFGLQGMIVTLTGFFSLFKDAGLSVATVQKENLTHEQASTLFWINLAVGGALTILVAAMGPLLVAFYKEPRLLLVTAASATTFLFNSIAVQHRALLERGMRFAAAAKIDLLSLTVGAGIGIGMAARGFGYWALVGQAVSTPIVSAAAAWIALPWFPGKPSGAADVRAMVRFGGTVTLNSFVVYLAYNTEKLLLGRFWGAAALGIYGRAYQLANLPIQQLTSSVGSVAFPVLSRMQGDAERFRRSFLKFLSVLVSLTVPIVVACALFAEGIVWVLFGQKWMGVAPVLRLLAPTVLVFALVNPFYWFLLASGRAARSLNIALLIAPVVILGVVAGLRHGPTGVALGYSIAMALLVVPLVGWSKHGSGITTFAYWDSIQRPLISGVIAGVAGWLVKVCAASVLGPISLLALELTVSFAVYSGLLLFVMGQKRLFADLLSQLLQRRQQARAEKYESADN